MPGTPDHRQYLLEREHLLDLQHLPESKHLLDLLHTRAGDVRLQPGEARRCTETRDRRSGEAG